MIDLPLGWTVALNVLVWPLWQMTVSYLSFRLPVAWFKPESGFFAPFFFERGVFFYDKLLRIRSWKSLLPDGAAFFAGAFRKQRVAGRDRAYLARFRIETCRGEAAHWVSFAFFPVFALWNPPWAVVVMFVYATLANLPCILAQRYNRFKLTEILSVSPRRRGG